VVRPGLGGHTRSRARVRSRVQPFVERPFPPTTEGIWQPVKHNTWLYLAGRIWRSKFRVWPYRQYFLLASALCALGLLLENISSDFGHLVRDIVAGHGKRGSGVAQLVSVHTVTCGRPQIEGGGVGPHIPLLKRRGVVLV
jgi:hypothetical protein